MMNFVASLSLHISHFVAVIYSIHMNSSIVSAPLFDSNFVLFVMPFEPPTAVYYMQNCF